MKRRIAFALTVGALALLLAGCFNRGYDIFLEKCPGDWSRSQKEAAWGYWLKQYYGMEEDGEWVINPERVTVDDVLKTVGSILADIDWVLNPDRSPRWRALLIEMDTLRQAFLREEERWLYISSQLRKVKLYYSFLELLGEVRSAGEQPYSILYLWPENTQFEFTASHIEKAKEEGKLAKVEEGFYYVYTPYGYKVRDPANPDDYASFVWQPKLEGFWVVSYAILPDDKPQELQADYVEIFRARLVDGQVERERLPCVRAFRKLNGTRLEVAVIDYDHEGESGYGDPDEVRKVFATTGWDIVEDYRSLREDLSQSRTEEKRIAREVVLKPLDLVIARLGEAGEYKGEYREEGWTVPYEYKDQYGVAYRAKLIEEELPDDYPFSRIAYVVKIWKDGAVWEFWRPKADYAVDMEYLLAVDRAITLQPVGKPRVTVSADAVIGTLYKIVYKEGDTWIELVDLDGTGILQYKIEGVPDPNSTTSSTAPTGSETSYKRNL